MSRQISTEQPTSIEQIELDTVYDFEIWLDGYGDFVGKFSCKLDFDNTPFVDLIFHPVISVNPLARNTGHTTESESNNSFSSAQVIPRGQSVVGFISYAGDVDYYRIDCVSNGVVDVTLSVPSSANMNLTIYNSSHTEIAYSRASGAGVDEFVRFNVNGMSSYYIYVNRPDGAGNHDSYTLHANYRPLNTWYSQMTSSYAGWELWNTEKLDNLYFSYDGYSAPFMVNGNSGSSKEDHMRYGCFLACWAMVLRNRNYWMTGTDFRTDYEGRMYADPYTAMLANIAQDGSQVTYTGGEYRISTGYDPVNVVYNNIRTHFADSSGIMSYGSASLTGTVTQKANAIGAKLASTSGGVIVFFNKSGFTHAIVFTEDLGSDLFSYERFKVYDPGTANSNEGFNVLFGDSKTYLTKSEGGFDIGLSSATSMYWIN